MYKLFSSACGLDQMQGGQQSGRFGVFFRLADPGAVKRRGLYADHWGGGGKGGVSHHGMPTRLSNGVDHAGQGADPFMAEHGGDAVFPAKRGGLGNQEAGPLHGRVDGGLGFEEGCGEGLGEFMTAHKNTFLRLAAG